MAIYPIEQIHAGCSMLTVSIMRLAYDRWGDDCEIVGHPAQRVAWEQQGLLFGDLDWDDDEKERIKTFWLGHHDFKIDKAVEKSTILFQKNGVTVGEIVGLAIPVGY